ncbi:unnamed protein product [Lactuca saligna]|uniref:Phosphofructokinase domain-containing protein n=1 Tax=Lactuca saligna TaxID=75948 RepID=A0AA35ZSP3_LACSI|nr:unnamed protein product [Lactuca saligna]
MPCNTHRPTQKSKDNGLDNNLISQFGVRFYYAFQVVDKSGYKGFYSSNRTPLTPKVANYIHKQSDTITGTSRGAYDNKKIVNSIEDPIINQVYIIGGDGTQKGAYVIHSQIDFFL